jgi:hypothetical protein
VRTSVALTELMQGLTFAPVGANGFTVSSAIGNLITLTRPTPVFFRNQLPLVDSWAELREERAAEVLAQIDNQIAFLGAVCALNVTRHRHTLELWNMGMQFAVAVEMRFKHALGCRRPVDYSAQVQPIITTPLHGCYPMGHAVQAYMQARMLQTLAGWPDVHPRTVQLQRQAQRISTNRIVAGVHFPVDGIAGQVMGESLAEYFLAACGLPNAPPLKSRSYGVNLLATAAQTTDFDGILADPGTALAAPPISAILKEITKLALAEW